MYLANASFSLLGFRFEQAFMDFDSGGPQLGETTAGDQRIGIAHGDEHALHSGRDHRVGARTGASGVRAGSRLR